MTFFQEERALLLACHCRDDRRLSQQDSRGGRPRHHLQRPQGVRAVRLKIGSAGAGTRKILNLCSLFSHMEKPVIFVLKVIFSRLCVSCSTGMLYTDTITTVICGHQHQPVSTACYYVTLCCLYSHRNGFIVNQLYSVLSSITLS